jgi:hypothetical protein
MVTDRTARLRASFVRILIPGIEDHVFSGVRLPQPAGSHRSQHSEEAADYQDDRLSVADEVDDDYIDDEHEQRGTESNAAALGSWWRRRVAQPRICRGRPRARSNQA